MISGRKAIQTHEKCADHPCHVNPENDICICSERLVDIEDSLVEEKNRNLNQAICEMANDNLGEKYLGCYEYNI